MADRVVTYDFRGNFTSLTAGLAASGRSVQTLGTQLTTLDAKGAKARAGLVALGGVAGKAALGAAAGLAAITLVTANFDKAMSGVAATGDEARASLDDLRQAALDAGAATAFSASQAAAGIENLLKAGVSVEDVLGGGLAGALDLAAAGELEVADAAEIAATAMTQFRLAGEDVPHIADLLAAGAGKAQGDVSDLAMALKQSGLVASQMGVSIEETTGTLAAFASAGLLGSDAGTSFRTMLLRLANPTDESADLMKKLGISAYDASGQFVGMASIAEQLSVAFEGKTQAERDSALATIFGSDAIRAAAVLYEQGGEGVQSWTDKVNDAGYAAEVAGVRLDNLSGDLEALRGSLETALIGMGEGSTGPLRELVQGLTDVVNAFSDLPAPVQAGMTGALALTAALGGMIFVGTRVVAGLASMQLAMVGMGVSATTAARLTSAAGKTMGAVAGLGIAALGRETAKTNKALGTFMTTAGLAAAGFAVGGPWGAGIGAAIGLVIGLGAASEQTSMDVDAFTAALDKQTGALTTNNRELAIKALGDADALVLAQKFGVDLDLVTDAALGNANAIAAVNTELDRYVATTSTEGMTGAEIWQQDTEITSLRESIGAVNGVVDESSDKWRENAAAMGDASDATDGFSSAAATAGQAAGLTTDQINALAQQMRDQANAALEAFDANTAWGRAVRDAREQAQSGAKGLDALTEAGQGNRQALSGLASAWNNQPKAVKNSESAYRNARQTFIEVATAMGVGERKARALANSLLEVPRKTVAKVEVTGVDTAMSAIQRMRAYLSGIPDEVINVRTNMLNGGAADGATVPKTGASYADRHPYLLADGEEVISNRYGQADRHRGLLKSINAGRLAAGGTAGFTSASGVRTYSATTSENPLADSIGQLAHSVYEWTDRTDHAFRRDLEKREERAKKEADADKAKLDAMVDARKQFESEIAGLYKTDVFAAGEEATYALFPDGSRIALEGGLGALTPEQTQYFQDSGVTYETSTGMDPIGGLEGDVANLEEAMRLYQELRERGFDGPAFREMAAKADVSRLRYFASLSRQELNRIENLYERRDQLSTENARFLGQGEFGSDIRGLRADVQASKEQVRIISAELMHLIKDPGGVTDEIRKHQRITAQSSRGIGRDFAQALNNAASNAVTGRGRR